MIVGWKLHKSMITVGMWFDDRWRPNDRAADSKWMRSEAKLISSSDRIDAHFDVDTTFDERPST